MGLSRDADTQEIVLAINILTKTVETLAEKVDHAIEHREHSMVALEGRVIQAETELRFVKWFGAAIALGTIALIIERASKVL